MLTFKKIVLVGTFFDPLPHEQYLVFGNWIKHPKFGEQFKVERAVETRPNTRNGIIRYLSSGLFKGIGEATAQKLVEAFGLDTFKILDENPEKIKLIPKLGKKTGKKIIAVWKERNQFRDTFMFLSRHDITPNLSNKIIRVYGENTIDLLSENPYRLISQIRGIGFLTADKIARSMTIAKDHPQRIEQAILFLLEQAESNGNCFLTEKQLKTELLAILELKEDILFEKIDLHIHTLRDKCFIYIDKNSDGENVYYSHDVWNAEKITGESLFEILQTPLPLLKDHEYINRVENWLEKYCVATNISLSSKQKEGVLAAACSKVFILTGGPGVGKTTTANTIIRLFKAMRKSVALAAPTGRAAQRLTEVSSVSAKTIHRLLEWSAQKGGFIKSKHNKIAADIIIIDEVSMLDIRLASSLFPAINKTSQLILIGDADQLPSVGCGNVLRDILAAKKTPALQLTEIFRQGQNSQIIKTAHAINSGTNPIISNEALSDCQFIETASNEETLEIMLNLVTDILPKAGYDAMRDIQILTPMNKGELGAQTLNVKLQKFLNPIAGNENTEREGQIRQYDKIIQLSNNYDLNVFNGDIGRVQNADIKNRSYNVSFNERLLQYDAEQANDLALAYAITIHKSQGSEFQVVVIPLSMSHYVMLQRNLIYTALTRAKKLAVFVGSKKALAFAVRNETSSIRQTGLTKELEMLFSF